MKKRVREGEKSIARRGPDVEIFRLEFELCVMKIQSTTSK